MHSVNRIIYHLTFQSTVRLNYANTSSSFIFSSFYFTILLCLYVQVNYNFSLLNNVAMNIPIGVSFCIYTCNQLSRVSDKHSCLFLDLIEIFPKFNIKFNVCCFNRYPI